MVQWIRHINIKDKMKKKTFWGKLLAAFFVLMALSTVVSRAADSVIVPRVRLERASSGSVTSFPSEAMMLPEPLKL